MSSRHVNMASGAHHCKDCGLYFESAKSLDVHLHYHKENLLSKWASQAAQPQQQNEESPNSNNHVGNKHGSNNDANNGDSSSEAGVTQAGQTAMKSVPGRPPSSSGVFRSSPQTFHPPAPTNYVTSSSPYQPGGNGGLPEGHFSPSYGSYQGGGYPQASSAETRVNQQSGSFQNYANSPMMSPHDARGTSLGGLQPGGYFVDTGGGQGAYPPEQFVLRGGNVPTSGQYRYHPYNGSLYPVPHPPPHHSSVFAQFQCDKCGYVCDSSTSLAEHINNSHGGNVQGISLNHQGLRRQQELAFSTASSAPYMDTLFYSSANDRPQQVKTEPEPAEILDLDSHKVHVYQPPEPQTDKNRGLPPFHSPTPVMLWSAVATGTDSKPFQHGMAPAASSPEYITPDGIVPSPARGYQQYSESSAVISSSAVPPGPSSSPQVPAASSLGSGGHPHQQIPTKQTNNQSWKSNDAKRPKTYNCSACNKWFTSSGHLKRHYNTTLHKNAVKQSGAPDPAKSGESNSVNSGGALGVNQIMQRASGDSSATPSPSASLGEESSRSSVCDDGFSQTHTNPSSVHTPTPTQTPTPTPMLPPTPQGFQQSPQTPSSLPSPPNRVAGPSESPQGGLFPNSNSSTVRLAHMPHIPSQPTSQVQVGQQLHQPTRMAFPNGLPPHVSTTTTIINNNDELHATFLPSEQRNGAHNHNSYQLAHPQPLHHPLSQFQHHVGTPNHYTNGVLPTFNNIHHNHVAPGYHYITQSSENVGGLSAMNLMEQQLHHQGNFTAFNGFHVDAADQFSPAGPQMLHQGSDSSADRDDSPVMDVPPPPPPRPVVVTRLDEPTIHKCLDCDKIFNKACYLTQHNKSFHSGDKPFKCNTCGKRFPAEFLYQEHLSKHAGEKPYKCEICPKQFNHKTDLRRHMCLHTGEKPYACDVCGKGFIRKDHMLKHAETHRRKLHHPM